MNVVGIFFFISYYLRSQIKIKFHQFLYLARCHRKMIGIYVAHKKYTRTTNVSYARNFFVYIKKKNTIIHNRSQNILLYTKEVNVAKKINAKSVHNSRKNERSYLPCVIIFNISLFHSLWCLSLSSIICSCEFELLFQIPCVPVAKKKLHTKKS